MCWLIRRFGNGLKLAYAATERNAPIRDFLNDPAITLHDDFSFLDGEKFLANHEHQLELFTLEEPGVD